MFKVSFADFCHDSAIQASLIALAAPKVQSSMFNGQWMTCLLCQLVMFWNTVAGFGTPFALPKENCSEKYKPQINNYHAER